MRPGSADLTLKLKDVRPDVLPPVLDACRPSAPPDGGDQGHAQLDHGRPPKPARLAVKVASQLAA